jgi:hypothetical protein
MKNVPGGFLTSRPPSSTPSSWNGRDGPSHLADLSIVSIIQRLTIVTSKAWTWLIQSFAAGRHYFRPCDA